MMFFLIALIYGSNSLSLNAAPWQKVLSVKTVNTTSNVIKAPHMDLMASIKSNPKEFVAEMSQVDPTALRNVITLLEELKTTSEARETHLIDDLSDKSTSLDEAGAQVAEKEGVLEDANEAAAAASADLDAWRAIHATRTLEKNNAQAVHDDEVPVLNNEQAILTEVINSLNGLHDDQKRRYIGCFVDDGDRDLDNFVGSVSSPKECQALCDKAYFSTQAGSQCFCGDAYGTASQYVQVEDSACDAQSGGNQLGGSWRNTVFRNIPYGRYIGCFVDDGDRDLPDFKADVQTPEACHELCQDKAYYSLQANHQCFCGDGYQTNTQYTQVDDAECNAHRHHMGNSWRNAVFGNN